MPFNTVSVPEWLGAAVLGAVISLVGFIGKLIFDSIKSTREEKKKKFASLVELCSLINASYDVFKKQNDLVMGFCRRVRERLHIGFAENQGYDAFLSSAFPEMNEEEKEVHGLIRGYTNGLFDINHNMLQWLQKDFEYKTGNGSPEAKALTAKLNILESHLYLWVAKYNSWIPSNQAHSLVYLADEAHHGKGFPIGIEQDLNAYLRKYHKLTFPFSVNDRHKS